MLTSNRPWYIWAVCINNHTFFNLNENYYFSPMIQLAKPMNYMKSIFLICGMLFLISNNAFSQKKKLCVTMDDLLVVSYGVKDIDYFSEVTTKLIATFKTYNIPAIGYVNESKLYVNLKKDSSRVQLLESWLKNGLELGNHTFSHTNYHDVSLDSFRVQILTGEETVRPLCEANGQKLMYFRHPYLKAGETKLRTDSLTKLLSELGYIEAPVTIDNEDYYFAKAYHVAWEKEDKKLMEKIGSTYLTYMDAKIKFFEGQSIKLFNRPMAQTLLVHANLLNAHYFDKLAQVYLDNGYEFVSQTEVLKDPAYKEEITKFRNWGISWIDRWALSQGKTGDFFKGDPVTPKFIMDGQQ